MKTAAPAKIRSTIVLSVDAADERLTSQKINQLRQAFETVDISVNIDGEERQSFANDAVTLRYGPMHHHPHLLEVSAEFDEDLLDRVQGVLDQFDIRLSKNIKVLKFQNIGSSPADLEAQITDSTGRLRAMKAIEDCLWHSSAGTRSFGDDPGVDIQMDGENPEGGCLTIILKYKPQKESYIAAALRRLQKDHPGEYEIEDVVSLPTIKKVVNFGTIENGQMRNFDTNIAAFIRDIEDTGLTVADVIKNPGTQAQIRISYQRTANLPKVTVEGNIEDINFIMPLIKKYEHDLAQPLAAPAPKAAVPTIRPGEDPFAARVRAALEETNRNRGAGGGKAPGA